MRAGGVAATLRVPGGQVKGTREVSTHGSSTKQLEKLVCRGGRSVGGQQSTGVAPRPQEAPEKPARMESPSPSPCDASLGIK